MAIEDPPGVLNVDSTDAAVIRHMTQAIVGAPIGAFSGGVGATAGFGHGVSRSDSLVVTESDTPGMSVKVSAGTALVMGTASALQGPYSVYNDSAVEALTVAPADAVNPRNDLVIAQVRDTTYDGSGERDARLIVVTGTPAGTPSDPSLAAFPNALVLARISVPALAASITNGQITDLRTYAGMWALPFGRVASVSFGTNQPGIAAVTDLIGMSVDAPMIAGRRYKITAEATFQQLTAAGTIDFQLTTPGNSIYRQRRIALDATAQAPVTLTYEHVAAATGNVGFKLRAGTTAGTVTARPAGVTEMNHVLLVEDIGPA